MDPVIHFEMPAEDKKRAAEFYSKVFGWEMKQLGPELGNYLMAMTAESDEKGPKKPGVINGGFFAKMPEKPDQYPGVVVQVGDIYKAMQSIEEAGGKVLGTPDEIPGVGLYVSFRDTEGNRVAMLQVKQS